ncbi:beta/gamma crystallin domain-containing protein 1-like [Artemia franciscana]|uniref:Uncharacterized protein n=1 Tax=Artemia franciscana TaxID=6661 RepID=A0AA88I9Y0_ARTSF|nr:hypothetical protein QYM36_001685 [Artemia franciscana]
MLKVGVVLLLCVGSSLAVNQQLFLIDNNANNETIESTISISGYIQDLADLNFDKRASTACVVSGLWLLYSNRNFNTDSILGNAVHFVYGDNVCSGSTFIVDEISSVRYAGSFVDWKANSMNLYGKDWYQGREQFLVGDAYTVLLGNVRSLIVSGTSPWIVFDEESFAGNGVCIRPFAPEFGQPGMYPNIEAAIKSAKISTEEECQLYPQF